MTRRLEDSELYPHELRALKGATETLSVQVGTRDHGLKLALMLASDELDDAEDYFDQRADASFDNLDEGAFPNEAMRRLVQVRRAREILSRCIDALP